MKRLEQGIAQSARQLPGYQNLISIKGIGPLSAAILLSLIGDVKEFGKPKQLTAYFGLVPRVNQSNERQITGRITKRGSRLGRKTLVLCTLIAKRFSPYLDEFYQRIKARRGSAKAIIATARRFLTTIYYTLKNGWIFEDFSTFTIRA